MAIIVNKEEKRRNIALACRELLLEHGIENLTISQIAKAAGVGKGTIYEYFNNKEDIVFEIITTFIAIYEEELQKVAISHKPLREKLFYFFYMLFESETARRHLVLYKEFLAVSLLHESEEMLHFSEACRIKFSSLLLKILEQAEKEGELPSNHVISPHSLILFATGLVIDSRLKSIDIAAEIKDFLTMILGEENR